MNTETQNALNQIFNIAPSEPLPPTTSDTLMVVSEVAESVPAPGASATIHEIRAEEDFLFSRSALKSLAVEAQTTLHRAVEVADQTDKASSFTAVAELLRATIETHKQLHDLHKTSAEIRVATSPVMPATTVNVDKGIVFQGDAASLLKLIDPSRK